MGDRPVLLKVAAGCAAAVAGVALAATVASAQGPGDYEPPPTTTTTLPGPGPGGGGGGDDQVSFRAKADAGVLKAKIEVKVNCDEPCSANAHGKLRLVNIPGLGNGKANFKLGSDEAPMALGKTKLVLKVPRRGRRVAERAFEGDGRVQARIAAEASDAAGNVGVDQLRLKFSKVK